jgi:hypothetical protein
MKKFILVQLFLFTVVGSTKSQNDTAKLQVVRSFNQGISVGVYLSNFVKGTDWSLAHYHTLDANFNKKIRAGFYFGYSREIYITKRFYCEAGIYYNHNENSVIYHEWSRNGSIGIINDANFIVSYSRVSLSLLPCMSFGRNFVFNLFAGPYFEAPFLVKYIGQITSTSWNELTKTQISSSVLTNNEIYKILEKGFGGLIGVRLDVPINLDYLGFEIRMGKSFNNIIEFPNAKESFKTVSIIYLFRIKKHGTIATKT